MFLLLVFFFPTCKRTWHYFLKLSGIHYTGGRRGRGDSTVWDHMQTHVPLRPAVSSLDLQTVKVNEILLQPAGASEARAATAHWSTATGTSGSATSISGIFMHFISQAERAYNVLTSFSYIT
jgi:hypothetical protein